MTRTSTHVVFTRLPFDARDQGLIPQPENGGAQGHAYPPRDIEHSRADSVSDVRTFFSFCARRRVFTELPPAMISVP